MRLALLLAVSLLATACDDLDDYRATGGPGGQVFRGTVIGGVGECPPATPDCSFIRVGFPPGTELILTFDPVRAQSSSPPPGTLTTTDACMLEPSFDAIPLEPIAQLSHDLLSQYEFPGGGRVRNYLFVAHATTGCLVGRDAMVFLSLMDDGTIEVRIVVGAGIEARGDRFGVFVTTRQPS